MRSSRYSSRVAVIAMLCLVSVTASACGKNDIIEPPVVAATVYGTATIAGQGVAGRPVVVVGFTLQCQQRVAVGGNGVTDATGTYRIVLGGSAPVGPICVRVGIPPAGSGIDTVFAHDTVAVRTSAPYDSVRINVNRTAP